ncbi:MAG: AraC family transcriptional regulator [Rikenellaceae bacterium]
MQKNQPKRRIEVTGVSNGFQFGIIECRYFPKPTQQRRCFELLYINKGEGLCFAGDQITQFLPGELLFFGVDTPHYLKSAKQFYAPNYPLRCGATSVKFNEGVLPSEYSSLLDCDNINHLIKSSQRGIRWHSNSINSQIVSDIESMEQLPGLERYIQLLRVLNKLGEMLAAGDGEMISTARSEESLHTYDGAYQHVIEFISHNFHRNITLDELAEHTKMNRTALCRHFRGHAGRSIFEYLLEFRLNYAKQMLQTTNLPIAEIAQSAGFNNLPNFNVQFKRSTTITPGEYRIRNYVKESL